MKAEKERSKDAKIRRVYLGGIWTEMYNYRGFGVAIQRPSGWDFRLFNDIFLTKKQRGFGRKLLAR